MLSPLSCANTFIREAMRTNTPLSHMKLQKLLYLLYARYYAQYGVPLFANNFEPWKYGPVVAEVYYAFCKYGAEPIDDFYYDCNHKAYVVEMSDRMGKCFRETWNKFGNCSGMELSRLTHNGVAWRNAKDKVFYLNSEDIKEDGRRLFEQRI